MAFDQQLEADRIDGFNLFSAFVRVPLLVLGGILGGDGSSSCDDADGESLSKHAANIDDSSDNHSDSQFHGMSADSLNRSNQSRRILSTSSTASSSSNSSSESTTESCHNKYEIKRKKRMSWSDESGLPLVYENDEVRRNQMSSTSSGAPLICWITLRFVEFNAVGRLLFPVNPAPQGLLSSLRFHQSKIKNSIPTHSSSTARHGASWNPLL